LDFFRPAKDSFQRIVKSSNNHNMRKGLSIIVATAGTLLLTAAIIDLGNLLNYENQPIPGYIVKDNTTVGNPVRDEGATLGRVLFYDKQLSLNGTISCASCHKQALAFGDDEAQSIGLDGGLTGRHSMRLANARFGTEVKFFWDERASTLEDQTTRPIQDHVEMGFSGTNGQPGFDSLITRLEGIEYYQQLFTFVYGTPEVTEDKVQRALAQFVRSIQSFDSKFDIGRAQAPNDGAPFPNFTQNENVGKQLFLAPPPQGAGCQGCHRAPEFDIDPASLNNGVIGVAGSPGSIDLTNTRAPSLRNVFNPQGQLNGPLMHTGSFTTMEQVIEHYNLVPQNPANTNLDNRLAGPGGNLQLTALEKQQLVDFLKTLSGNAVYTDERWSDPFDPDGSITILPLLTGVQTASLEEVQVYPNPATEFVRVNLPSGRYDISVHTLNGARVLQQMSTGSVMMDVSQLPQAVYIFRIQEIGTGRTKAVRVVKR